MDKELILIILPDNSFDLDWITVETVYHDNSRNLQKKLFNIFKKDKDEFLFVLSFSDERIALPLSISYLRGFTREFRNTLLTTPELNTLRDKINIEPEAEILNKFSTQTPYLIGLQYLTNFWLKSIWIRLLSFYKKRIKEFDGSAEDFLQKYNSEISLAGRVFFHLVESKNEDTPFAFLATYSVVSKSGNKTAHLPLKNALLEFGKNAKKMLELLSTVYAAARQSKFINEILESGEIFHPLSLSADDALIILKELPLYEKCGILCRAPDWWKKKYNVFSVDIEIGKKAQSLVGAQSLLSFEPRILLGGEEITLEEAERILAAHKGLVMIKNKWIEVDSERLKQIIDAYKKAKSKYKNDGISVLDAIRMQLSGQSVEMLSPENEDLFNISFGDWFKEFIEKLKNPVLRNPDEIGKGLCVNLREYQIRGVNWLNYLYSLGFGACLADDMGLGKTIQVIALFNQFRDNLKMHTPNLLVVPASLIANWSSEIKKFAPEFNFYIAHPSENLAFNHKTKPIIFKKFLIVITSYGTLHRYKDKFEMNWNCVILDEAQAIKNPATHQTKTVKKLNAKHKMILTGTPIENRLMDLWSLFDFLNPGLLGSLYDFKDFCAKLQNNNDGYSRLRNTLSPFILRRLKTDKTIIADLPDKIEMKVYSDLTKKQLVLYSDLVEDLRKKLETTFDPFIRRTLVVIAIMKFKQLCNHPAQLSGSNDYNPEDSGKFLRLREICETIYEKRERVLIFSQFAEIVEPLKNYLENIFEHKGLMIHGGIPVPKRKNIVKQFQDTEYVPFMIMSLKTGGVGLNLTAANHIIHFDRWWNPAVENQATDRAFRIGQKKNVIVHKFITKSTIEEKIDLIIENKVKLASDIITATGENWITEMNNEQLMDLFKFQNCN